MSDYQGKVLELVAIEKNQGKSYLRIKLSFEKEVEIFWEIDDETVQNLKDKLTFDGSHKYRLSLHTGLDRFNNQPTGYITKTYRESSERISFACSVHYKNDLDSIKNAASFNDINSLSFVTENLLAMDEEKLEQKKEQNELAVQKKYKPPFKWVSVAIISILFLFLIEYTNSSSFLNEAKVNNTPIAIAQVSTTEVHLETNKNSIKPNIKSINGYSASSIIPYIELEDSISYSIPKGYVSFTFDDGPSKYTVEIIDILKKYEVGGTFFFIGYNAKKYPDYVRYVQSNGYSIGTHTMNHVNMSNLPYEKQEDELIQSVKAIQDITNEEVTLLRPPFGALNQQTKDIILDTQNKIVLWNSDPRDWENHDADKIFDYVLTKGASGSIILLHESQAVVDALPRLIEYLQEQNLEIVNLK